MNEFNTIKTRAELARFLGITSKLLTNVLYHNKVDAYYECFSIRKRDGGYREICASRGVLKELQCKLANALKHYDNVIKTEYGITTNISHGFIAGKSILTNATIHRNKRFVVNIDLKDFFPSFHFGRVVGFFEKNRYYLLPHEVAVTLAQIVCYKGRLPQGAPTSPIISNLICQILDYRVLDLAKKYKLDYSRYADDLSFSTNRKDFPDLFFAFLNELSVLIEKSGFSINPKKTRLFFKDSRQTVTGLIVNKRISVKREFAKETRAMAHSLFTNGTFTCDGIDGTLSLLEGRLSFIEQIDKHNNLQSSGIKVGLSCREEVYKDFLFYKCFFANEKPLVVTEGKTDIRYIKAALKKYYIQYPDLIKRDETGGFRFQITFFKRSDKIRSYLGIGKDGADALQRIYQLLVGDKKGKSYEKKFTRESAFVKGNPVILLYDNELKDRGKNARPLYNFAVKVLKLREEELKKLKTNLWLRVRHAFPLYIATLPLCQGKDQCEIEELFSKDTLEMIINGKKLSLDNNHDNSFYGKDEFSRYIERHYDEIDFAGFIPLLDAINQIVNEKRATYTT